MTELTTYESTNIVAIVFGSMFATLIVLIIYNFIPKSWKTKLKQSLKNPHRLTT